MKTLKKDFFIHRNQDGKILPMEVPYTEEVLDKKTGKKVKTKCGTIKVIPLSYGQISEILKGDNYGITGFEKNANIVFKHLFEPKFDSLKEVKELGNTRIGRIADIILDVSNPKNNDNDEESEKDFQKQSKDKT